MDYRQVLPGYFFLVIITLIRADFDLTILHTNDVHARVGQTNAYSSLCHDEDIAQDKCYAGVARRLTKINEIRSEKENVLLLDGGDQYQGTIWFTYYYGYEASYFMNKLGYDAMGLGNHEFDNGVDGLVHFLENVTFPVLSSNIDAGNDDVIRNKFSASINKTVGGQKIGIIGYTVKELKEIVDPDGTKNLLVTDEIEKIREEAVKMKNRGINKIIAVGHSGIERDKEIAAQVEEVDIVVGGHSHSFIYTGSPPDRETPEDVYPVVIERESGTTALVVTAYAYGKYLGHLDVTFDDNGQLKSWGGNPILLDSSVPEDKALAAEVAQWEVALKNFTSERVGETYVHLEGDSVVCRFQECNLGNLLTDALLESANDRFPPEGTWTKVAAAFWNGGGIRAPIQKGTISLGDVLTSFPFNNELDLLEMKGSLLKDIFEHSVSKHSERLGRFAQVSGFKVTYDVRRPVNDRVKEILVRCEDCTVPEYFPLDLDKVYPIITSNFLYNGGDGFSMIKDRVESREFLGTIAADAVRDYISKHSPIVHGVEGRISFYTGDEPVPCKSQKLTTNLFLLLLISTRWFLIE